MLYAVAGFVRTICDLLEAICHLRHGSLHRGLRLVLNQQHTYPLPGILCTLLEIVSPLWRCLSWLVVFVV